jgi:hypothetical protein
MKIRIGSSLLVIAAILLGTASMSAQGEIKLPPRDTSSKAVANVPAFNLVTPGGGEIYKVSARYPPQYPAIIPGKITVCWKGGPVNAQTQVILADVLHWQSLGVIWTGTNTGQGQCMQWAIPANFAPTNDQTSNNIVNPGQYGKYLIYIQNTNPTTTWTYGPEFYIVWDY